MDERVEAVVREMDLPRYAASYGYANEDVFWRVSRAWKERGWLTRDEFVEAVEWKSSRARERAGRNPSIVVERVTGLISELEGEMPQEELDRFRAELLTSLDGVGVPVASALLAMYQPERYGVMDRRAWKTLFGRDKAPFTARDYVRYLRRIRELGAEVGLTPREVDKALWQYDSEHRSGPLYT